MGPKDPFSKWLSHTVIGRGSRYLDSPQGYLGALQIWQVASPRVSDLRKIKEKTAMLSWARLGNGTSFLQYRVGVQGSPIQEGRGCTEEGLTGVILEESHHMA